MLDLLIYVTFIAFGFVVLHFGCSRFLTKLPILATNAKLPDWFVSSILLAFGTSLPEIVIVLNSIYIQDLDIAVSSIIGSNTANLGLALGLLWLIFGLQKVKVNKKMLIQMILIEALLSVIILYYELNIFSSCVLITALTFFIIEKSLSHKDTHGEAVKLSSLDYFIIITSFIAIPLGSTFIVHGVTTLNAQFGISKNFLGAIVLAIGTSIPEIYTSFIALKRNKPEVALGNIFGSNIINSTFVIGLVGLFTTYKNESVRTTIDIKWMLGISILTFVCLTFPRRHRIMGGILFLVYALYLMTW